MFKRLALLSVLSFSLCGAAHAAGKPYDAQEFTTLQDRGSVVLVHVHATWCPVCKAQDPILNEMFKDARFQDLHGIEVDFDKEKPFLKTWHVASQSTLILFKGGKEIARTVGQTRPADIEALMLKAS